MHNRRILSSLLLSAVMFTTSCKTNNWRKDQFEGRWELESSGGVSVQVTSVLATFTLGHNGRFTAKYLPSSLLRAGSITSGQTLGGSGTWALTRNVGGQDERVRLTFLNVEGGDGLDLPYGAELFIQGTNKGPRLYYFNGDPDENQQVVFNKELSSSPTS